MAKTNSLTTGPIPGLTRSLAVPTSVGFLFSTLFNVVDTWFAGKLSTQALAALSLSFPVFFLIIAFGGGTSAGASALTGTALGRKDHATVRRNAAQALTYGLCLSLVLTPLGIWSSPYLFRLMGASGDYLAISVEYMTVIFSGAVFFLTTHMFNSTLVAHGDTKPFRNFLIGGFLLNCILDPWFIHGGAGLPAMGLKGVSLATVAVQILGCVYLGLETARTGLFKGARFAEFLPELRTFKEISRQAMPASFNYLTIGMGIFIITWFISRFGEEGVAAYGAAVRIEQIALLPTIGLNTATLALTAQNHGAGRMDRVRQSVAASMKYGAWITALGSVALLAFGPGLMRFFSQDPRVIEAGGEYLRIDALALFAYVILFVNLAALQGLKKPMFALWIGLARQIVAPAILFHFVAVRLGFGLSGIWWSIFAIVWASALVAHLYSRRQLRLAEELCRKAPEECGDSTPS